MKLDIDLSSIPDDLYINEYILLKLTFLNKGSNFIKNLGQIDYDGLQAKGYIKFNPENFDIILRSKGLSLFKLSVDTFKEFYLTYPEKTPGGRPLRTSKIGTNIFKNCANIWSRKFRNKPTEATKALEALKKELAYRKAEDKLEFFVHIEKWISENHFENTYEVAKEASFSSNYGFDDL